jgi:hypothetical protein
MLDGNEGDLAYQRAFIEPLALGSGVCATLAQDDDGERQVLVGTFNVEDDPVGRAMHSEAPLERAAAAVFALGKLWNGATEAGYTPLRP